MQLAVYNTVDGRLEGLDPSMATALPIPTARVVAVRPTVGTMGGELVYESSTSTALIWDGANWKSVKSDFLHIVDTDTVALAGNYPIGDVAISKATGNFFVHRTAGVMQWGVRTYPTNALLQADNPPEGSMAMALDDGSFWLMTLQGWKGSPIQYFATEALLLANGSPDGTLAWGDDTGLIYARSGGTWRRVNSPTITVGGTAPTRPASGDLFYSTHRQGNFEVYDGANWHIVGHDFQRGTFANRPTYANSEWGDVYSCTDTNEVYLAGETRWRLITAPADGSVNDDPVDQNWNNRPFTPAPGRISTYKGMMRPVNGTEYLVLAIQGAAGAKFMNTYFKANKTGGTNISNNGASASTDNHGGGGPGDGWYACSQWQVGNGKICTFTCTVDRTVPTDHTITVDSTYLSNSNELMTSRAIFAWDNNVHPLENIYWSEIQGGGVPNTTMRQV